MGKWDWKPHNTLLDKYNRNIKFVITTIYNEDGSWSISKWENGTEFIWKADTCEEAQAVFNALHESQYGKLYIYDG